MSRFAPEFRPSDVSDSRWEVACGVAAQLMVESLGDIAARDAVREGIRLGGRKHGEDQSRAQDQGI